MGREAERAAILVDFKAHLPVGIGAISWPNVAFKTPNNEAWAAVRINELGSYRKSLGRDFLKRHYGSLQIDLYCPSGIGTAESKIITDWLEDRYESLELITSQGERIVFQTPNSRDISGVQERQEGTNDNWYRRVFDAGYYRDSNIHK